MKQYMILAIESSCDETAIAIYHTQKKLISHTLYSQIALHKKYGGVVPELASRSHIEKISDLTKEALNQANITLNEIDIIAATTKPGLPGSLLVGTCFAKALAITKNKKFIGINHLEGHAFSAFIENEIEFPSLCLTASGGHTSLYLIENFGSYHLLGTTQDDAAGEAFDKISKMLNLGYPGGPIIEKYAKEQNFYDFFNYPRCATKEYNMSFSGLKTAILYHLIAEKAYDMQQKTLINHDITLKQKVASSLLVCIGDIFKTRILRAFKEFPQCKSLCFVGGVACNKYLQSEFKKICENHHINFYVPSPLLCTDNAAMIAFVAQYKAQQEEFSPLNINIL